LLLLIFGKAESSEDFNAVVSPLIHPSGS